MLALTNVSGVQKEFERLQKACETDKVKLPTKRQIEKKAAHLQKLADQPMTEVRPCLDFFSWVLF